MEHFLRTSNMRLGRLTLATTYLSQHIDTDIPLYHQELLRAWTKHHCHHTRIRPPSSLVDILHEPLFRSLLLQHNGQPIYYKHWISAGLTQVKDLCYIVVPGLLPAIAIHEFLAHEGISQTFQRTVGELQGLLHAFPPPWLQAISSSVVSPSSAPTQPFFSIPNTSPGHPPLGFYQGKTCIFYLHLMNETSSTPTLAFYPSAATYLQLPSMEASLSPFGSKQTGRHQLENYPPRPSYSALSLQNDCASYFFSLLSSMWFPGNSRPPTSPLFARTSLLAKDTPIC